jgi:hypothetical protein
MSYVAADNPKHQCERMSCVVQTIAVNESTFRKQVLQCMCCNACCTRHVNCELLPNVVCGVRGCFLPYEISTACLGRYSGDRYRGGPPADADIPTRCARDRFSGLGQQPSFHRLLRLLACIRLPCSNVAGYVQGFAKNDMAQMFFYMWRRLLQSRNRMCDLPLPLLGVCLGAAPAQGLLPRCVPPPRVHVLPVVLRRRLLLRRLLDCRRPLHGGSALTAFGLSPLTGANPLVNPPHLVWQRLLPIAASTSVSCPPRAIRFHVAQAHALSG